MDDFMNSFNTTTYEGHVNIPRTELKNGMRYYFQPS